MIRKHEFNSKWWGSNVGIVEDVAFFDLSPSLQDEHCEGYAWVEFSAPLDSAPPIRKLGQARFDWVDIQIPFRIGLNKIPVTSSSKALSATSAREAPFQVSRDAFKAFEHERFRFLPDISTERLNERYAVWSNLLIAEHPEWCLAIWDGSDIQGWFLCQAPAGKPLELTLAMLSSNAHISGHLLYQKAMQEFAVRGAKIGTAAFSVANTAVMNIYASLGARFLAARGYWLRLPARGEAESA